ncbi:MAG: hypothetical protein Q7S59_01445 [Sulfurimonas sp.]|nr:hypothetical protein [Sulfurimonas sp.]
MGTFRIRYKSFLVNQMAVADIRAYTIKEAVQKLKELHQNVEVFAFIEV